MKVDLFIPCFVDQFYPAMAMNVVKVLEKLDVEVSYNERQRCCGQPFFNSGYWKEAKKFAEQFFEVFDENRIIVSPSASCIGYIRNYFSEVLKNDLKYVKKLKFLQENVFEFSEFLVKKMETISIGAKFEHKVTYHDSCAGLRECKIKEEPRKLLEGVKGLEFVEMAETDVCCGFGGSFSVKFEPVSVAMAEQKVKNAVATGAEFIVTTDASCMMNLQGYIDKQKLSIKTIHIADVLSSGW